VASESTPSSALSAPARPIVGWRERVDLPEWGLKRIRAKIDTGARTSAIDVARIEELPDGRIRFEIVSRVAPSRKTHWLEATPVRSSIVKPSHGEPQHRYVCRTRMTLGPLEHDIEISLVCRKGMLCRMLLGRTALDGAALVNPAEKYLLTPRRVKKDRKGSP
jgi:hypothetical protein